MLFSLISHAQRHHPIVMLLPQLWGEHHMQ
jgi:hypothetical protein